MIRLKIISIIILCVAVLTTTLYIVSRTILEQSFGGIEHTLMLRNLTRVDSAILNIRHSLNIKLRDWAQWDDAYQFIQDGNSDFIDSNLNDPTLVNLELHLMVFVNRAGEVVFSKYMNLSEETSIPSEKVVRAILNYKDKLLSTQAGESKGGIIAFEDKLLILEAWPITQSSGEDPAMGTIIFGRFIDDKMVKSLKDLTQLSLSISLYTQENLPVDMLASKEKIASEFFAQPLSTEVYAGYFALHDITGAPIGIVKAEAPREVLLEGKKSTSLYSLMSAIAIVLVGISILFLVEKVLLKRFTHLTNEVAKISVTDLSNAHIDDLGNDEISRLAQKINWLLSELDKLQKQEIDAHTQELIATEKLKKGYDEAERMNKLMVNREMKMISLKEEIARLQTLLEKKSIT